MKICAISSAVALLPLSIVLVSSASWAEEVPRFEGDVVVTWIQGSTEPDRDMKLVEPFRYIDSRGHAWEVPPGAVINGASIPTVFWNTIGPPFVGDYRRASVVHDFHCGEQSQPWRDVHRMFYEASLMGGVGKIRAKMMYVAVYAKGPRWPEPGRLGATIEPKPNVSDSDVNNVQNWVQRNDPSLAEIEARLNAEAN